MNIDFKIAFDDLSCHSKQVCLPRHLYMKGLNLSLQPLLLEPGTLGFPPPPAFAVLVLQGWSIQSQLQQCCPSQVCHWHPVSKHKIGDQMHFCI